MTIFDPDYFAQRELAMNRAIALNRSTLVVDLFECSNVDPPPDELGVVRRAHGRALELGLTLPKFPRCTVQFVRAPHARQGAQTRKRGDVIEMVFVAGQPLPGLLRLALHELMHVHQLATGAWLSINEREAQAEMFAWRALEGWQL